MLSLPIVDYGLLGVERCEELQALVHGRRKVYFTVWDKRV